MCKQRGNSSSQAVPVPSKPSESEPLSNLATVAETSHEADAILEELLGSYGKLKSYLNHFTSSTASGEDLTQTAYLQVCRALGKGARPAKPLGWLFAIGRHVVWDHLFRRERLSTVPMSQWTLLDIAEPASREPLQEMLREEGIVRLRGAVDSLSHQERVFLHAYYASDRHLFNPATQFGISSGTAKVRAYRIRRKLRRLLER